MSVILGTIGVIICLLLGLTGPGGPIEILLQPYEYIVIVGIGICSVIIANPGHVCKKLIPKVLTTIKGSGINKKTYMDLLGLLSSLFDTIRKDGVLGIEEDIASPETSPRFAKYPAVLENHHVMETLIGALRLFVDGVVNAFDLERLLDTEIETHHEEESQYPSAINKLADAFPGIGIVAAVLGIIITMQFLTESPEVIGHHVAAALVGTMLGIFLSYGIVGPIATKLESILYDNTTILKCVQAGLVSFAGGAPPVVALEFSRKTIPSTFRPTSAELEELMRDAKKV
ncbi:MAG: flagellar motor stator protein MotA [Bdellovibrionota bacterium]|jgi:chemotaxis protein MotA